MKEKILKIVEKILFYFTMISLALCALLYLLMAIYSFHVPFEPIAKEFPTLAIIALILIGVTSVSFIILVVCFGEKTNSNEIDSFIVIKKEELANLRQTLKNQRKELSRLNKLINKRKL